MYTVFVLALVLKGNHAIKVFSYCDTEKMTSDVEYYEKIIFICSSSFSLIFSNFMAVTPPILPNFRLLPGKTMKSLLALHTFSFFSFIFYSTSSSASFIYYFWDY